MERQLGAVVTGCFCSAPPILVHCTLSQGQGNFQLLQISRAKAIPSNPHESPKCYTQGNIKVEEKQKTAA